MTKPTAEATVLGFSLWVKICYMYRTVVTICTASLTFSNSTFCPHGVLMCFVWIWEQTAIISLYSINWQVFVTETQCVFCAVRIECLHAMQIKFSLPRVKVQNILNVLERRASDMDSSTEGHTHSSWQSYKNEQLSGWLDQADLLHNSPACVKERSGVW